MPAPELLLESLVARCVDAGDREYRSELARLCVAHPEAAGELRERIAQLERLGFLAGAGSGAPGTSWFPDRIGGYQLTGVIGRGGMGVVFRALGTDGTPVALKVVRPDLLGDERARERFRREGRLASRLAHPGICTPLAIGVDEGVPWLAMPLLVGSPFGTWVREHRGARAALLGHLESCARALHAAHELGLVHRDVTPGNLFVTADDRAIVLDFGLARDLADAAPTLTLSQEQIGTLPYMAPEQLCGGRIDRRCDVYAMGIVLYEALAGRLPFVARQRSEMTRRIASGEAPRLRRVAPDVPRSLARIVEQAMDVDPARRYATAHELADDLRRFLVGRPVLAHELGRFVRLWRWSHNHPLASTTISLLAGFAVVAGFLLLALADEVRVHRATAATLEARTLERADPMRAIERALAAHDAAPTPTTLGQLNRLLHNVSLLATVAVDPSRVRGLAVTRVDEHRDLVGVAAEGALSLLSLDRRGDTLREQQRLPVDPGVLLRCVRFSPNGRFVAYGGSGKTAYVALVDAPAPLKLSGASGEVMDLVVDDTGEVWATIATGQILHWSGQPGASEANVLLDLAPEPFGPARDRGARGVKIGPGGDLLVWNWTYALRLRRDGTVVWHVPPVGEGANPLVAAFDATGERVLLGQSRGLRVVAWADGRELWVPDMPSPVLECAISPGGTIASLHFDGTLRFWADGQETASYRDPDEQLVDVLGNPHGDSFFAIGRGGRQLRIDAHGRVERTFPGGDIERWGRPGPYVWSSNGSLLLAAGGSGRLRAWDYDGSRGEAAVRLLASPPVAIARHRDGERLIVLTEDRQVWSWRPSEPAAAATGRVPMTLYCRTSDQDGDLLAVGGSEQSLQRVAVLGGERDEIRFPFLFPPRDQFGAVGLAWLPGRRLAVACGDVRFAPSRIRFVETTGSEVPLAQASFAPDLVIPDALGRLTCMDASRDGRRMVVGCMAGGLHLFESDREGPPYRHVRPVPTAGRVWTVDVAADGRRAVAGIEDGSVLLWRLDQPEPEVLVAPRGRPSRCMFAYADRLVVEFAPDGLVRMWDVVASPPCVVFEVAPADGAVVRDAAVLPPRGSSDGELRELRLATVSSDGWVRVWSLDGASLAARARLRLAALRPR